MAIDGINKAAVPAYNIIPPPLPPYHHHYHHPSSPLLPSTPSPLPLRKNAIGTTPSPPPPPKQNLPPLLPHPHPHHATYVPPPFPPPPPPPTNPPSTPTVLDLTPLYPPSLLPTPLRDLRTWYAHAYKDRFFTADEAPGWFWWFLVLEAGVHLPVSVGAVRGFLKGGGEGESFFLFFFFCLKFGVCNFGGV